ncbi:MAG: prepilin-type cleavage/methylation domain-containing protein, partial [Methylococcaceae bacterium]|nr:prepilin-type cleavage/methylation domain-containing protein [Methylococcaceae bacterium]
NDFSLAYFGSDDGVSEGSWEEEWLDKEVLPRLVKINIKLENGIFWPEMIIDLKISGTSNNTDLEIDDTDNSENTNESEAVE